MNRSVPDPVNAIRFPTHPMLLLAPVPLPDLNF
jgi:hypothetical protein